MKIHTPIYLPFALILVVALAMADRNGWSLIQSLASHTWQHTNPSTQHK